MKTWAAAIVIGSGPVRKAGARSAQGVEAILAERFATAGKPRLAFETTDAQFALFDGLPEAAERVLLMRAVTGVDAYRDTLDAWAAGDIRRLAATFAPAFRDTPVLQETLVTRRNARWSRWVAQRMARPGTVLVAVGAGHMVGDQSMIAMLRARGFAVRRVQ